MGKLTTKPKTRRDAADAVRLKAEGEPGHINAREAQLLEALMPEAAGPVVTKGLLAEAGRRGDDRVTRLIPAEAALLKARGGSGTVNPASGMLEYWDSDGGLSGSEGNDSVGNGGRSGDSKAGDALGGGGGGNDPLGLSYRAYDPRTMPSIESLLNTPSGYRAPGYEGLSMMQYSPPDTIGRLIDTYRYGPPPSYKALGAVPGRYGAPTGRGPGIMGTMAGFLSGNPMGAAMSLGMHFDQAMSPESREKSMAENQATGARNSTGGDADTVSGLSVADLMAHTPGARSGAQTAQEPAVPPGYAMNPAGQIVPLPQLSGGPWADPRGNNRPAYQDPIKNMLYDYIWRGPSGRGWA